MKKRKLKKWVQVTILILQIIFLPLAIIKKLGEQIAIIVERFYDLRLSKFFHWIYRKAIKPVVGMMYNIRYFVVTYLVVLLLAALLFIIINSSPTISWFTSGDMSIVIITGYFLLSFLITFPLYEYFKGEMEEVRRKEKIANRKKVAEQLRKNQQDSDRVVIPMNRK